jgi:hypothetical protein
MFWHFVWASRDWKMKFVSIKSNLRQKHRFVALWLSEWDSDGLGLFEMCKTATIYQLTPQPRFGHYQFPLQSVKDFWHISRLFQTLSSCLHR